MGGLKYMSYILKMRKGFWKKTRNIGFVVSFFALILLSSNLGSFFGNIKAEDYASPVGNDSDEREVQFLSTPITQEKVAEMKKINQERNASGEDLTPIIDGHGTGYACASDEYLDSLVGKMAYTGIMQDSSQNTPRTADSTSIADEQYFPAVGNQEQQGSCAAWATVYYAYGYLEARDYGWDASSGNPEYLLSPAWIYNKVVAIDMGSMPTQNAQLMTEWGVATLANMPYDDSTVEPWGEEAAWREAPYHRPWNYTLILYNPLSTIDLIKTLLSEGTPVVFGIDAYQFSSGLDDASSDYILSSSEYDNSSSLNHAQCFVGFDDSVSEGGDVGAFRVVNSWGADWMDGGYYWLTYDALKEFANESEFNQQILFITDRVDYNPRLIATWEFSDSPARLNNLLSLGAGDHSAPLATIAPHYNFYGYPSEAVFPEFMAFDISDFQPHYDSDPDMFFFVEISTVTSGVLSSFNIERYTGGSLVEISGEALNTPLTLPGYALTTFRDLDHEIKVSLELPDDPKFGYTYTIQATVANIGTNDETNVGLFLRLDGSEVGSSTFYLAAHSSQSFTFAWTPIEYKTYNFSVYAPPISGEVLSANNEYSQQITIKSLRNYLMTPGYAYSWIDATGGSSIYASGGYTSTSTSLSFDFPFYDLNSSSVWFSSTGLLSFSGYIDMYYYMNLPFPSSTYSYLIAPFWDIVRPTNYIYYQDFSNYFVVEWPNMTHSDGHFAGSFELVLYRTGEIVFNYDSINYTAGGYTCGLNYGLDTDYYNSYQDLSNLTDDFSILFEMSSIDHDLEVSLDIPGGPEINNAYTITARVQNVGLNDEENVELFLEYDEVEVGYLNIPDLPVGVIETITFPWTPTAYDNYNFTVYTYAVAGEENLLNNYLTQVAYVVPIKLFDGMYINNTLNDNGIREYGTSFTYTQLSRTGFHVNCDVLYLGQLYVSSSWDEDASTRTIDNSTGSGLNFGDSNHAPMWIFNILQVGDIVPIAVIRDGDHLFNVTGDTILDLPGFGVVEVWILSDLTYPGGLAYYEKNSGILIWGHFYYLGGAGEYNFDFGATNADMVRFLFDHDVKVLVNVPEYAELGETYVITAQIQNIGKNTETNVHIDLYYNGDLVNQTEVAELIVDATETITFTWSPMVYGSYDFTAIAPPVTDESYLANNVDEKIVHVANITLFDGMVVDYNFTLYSSSYLLSYDYSRISELMFHINMDIVSGAQTQNSYWDEEVMTRIMTNAGGTLLWGSGTHAITWIFVPASIGEIVSITVDGEGDHLFNITGDTALEFPGFGPVEAWVLSDLTTPGGIAYYEKTTGILINGTFLFAGGNYNYTLKLWDSNVFDCAPPAWVEPPSDQVIEYGDALSYDVNASDAYGIHHYAINDTTQFAINTNGGITSSVTLAVGEYWVEIWACDARGNNCSAIIRITVQDTTAPTWDQTPTDRVNEYGVSFSYDVNASDLSGINHYSVNDTTNFAIDVNGVLTNASILTVGEHWANITVYDPYGNYLSAIINITVVDVAPPTWDQTPADLVIEYGIALSYNVNASDISGIDHYWINYTVTFVIDGEGVLSNTVLLAVGEYWVNITAYDPLGLYSSAIINITVQDTTVPAWVQSPVDQGIKEGTPLSYDVGASDLSGIQHYSIDDTTRFAIDTNGVITSIDPLAAGEYEVEIRAYDPYGNYCSATIKITVEKGNPIAGYEWVIIGGMIGASVVGIGIYRKKRKARNFRLTTKL